MDTAYWKPPTVIPFNDCYELRDLVCVGDHIAVLNPNGVWHHGIYVKHGLTSMVIEVWGETDDSSHVIWRKFSQFVSDGTRFALIEYAEGTALSQDQTAALAFYLCEVASSFNIPLNNCKHFATLCRTLSWEQAQSITQCLESLPKKQVIPIKRGFK